MLFFRSKIPITIYPMFFLVAAAIGWLNSMSLIGTTLWILIISLSVLIHEYGHALTAVGFGQEAEINLVALGGLTQRKGMRLPLWKEFLVVLNGPLAGFLLCGIAYLLFHLINPIKPLVRESLEILIFVNFFWTLVNLLPVQPLDGGQLLSIVLEGMFGVKGIKFAMLFSVILGAIVSVVLFQFGLVLAGALFLMLAFESFRSWKASQALTENDQDVVLQKMFQDALTIQHENPQKALEKLQDIRNATGKGILYNKASIQLAELFSQLHSYQEAYDLLLPLKKTLEGSALTLLQRLAYHFKDWKQILEIGDRCYQESPNYQTAIYNAVANAALRNARPAIGWMLCAKQEGAPNLEETLKLPVFDDIRNDPAFQQLQE